MKTFKRLTTLSLMLVLCLLQVKADCDVTNLVVKFPQTGECKPNGEYRLRFNIRGSDLPNVATISKVVVGGDTYNNVPVTWVNSTKIRVDMCVRSRGRTNPDLFAEVQSGCTYTKNDFIAEEPECPDNPCDITSINNVNTTNCNANGKYRVRIFFSAVGLPGDMKMDKVFIKINGVDVKFFNRNIVDLGGGNYRVNSGLITPSGANNIAVFIEAEPGCTFFQQTSVDEPACPAPRLGAEFEPGLTVFPNPAIDQMTVISSEVDNPEVLVFNTVGQMVYRSKLTNQTAHTISLSKLQPGLYMVQLNGTAFRETRKVLVK